MPNITGRRQIYKGELLAVELVQVAYEDGVASERETVRHIPGVAVVALQERTDVVAYGTQVLLIQQYRAALEREVLEIVAGLMDEAGESPLETAQRELREETGFEAEEWVELGTLLSSPGFTDERITLFLARRLRRVGTDRDEQEHLTVCTTPFTLALEQVRNGEIQDAKTVAALLWVADFLTNERT